MNHSSRPQRLKLPAGFQDWLLSIGPNSPRFLDLPGSLRMGTALHWLSFATTTGDGEKTPTTPRPESDITACSSNSA